MMTDLDISSFVQGSEKLVSLFGYWPSFHDAEVIEFSLWRGDMRPDDDVWLLPELTAKLHVFEIDCSAAPGCELRKHTLVDLRFKDISGFSMSGFNHQNAIDELSFSTEDRGSGPQGEPVPPSVKVMFREGFGVCASFQCTGVELVSAVPWDPDAEQVKTVLAVSSRQAVSDLARLTPDSDLNV